MSLLATATLTADLKSKAVKLTNFKLDEHPIENRFGYLAVKGTTVLLQFLEKNPRTGDVDPHWEVVGVGPQEVK
jgi:hypothetical protein